MSEHGWPAAATAGDLTTEHYGLLVTWERLPREGDFTAPVRRSAVVDELRRWVNEEGRQVGITDMTPQGAAIGTEHHLPASTPITIERRIRKARRRPWSKAALNPGEMWPALSTTERSSDE